MKHSHGPLNFWSAHPASTACATAPDAAYQHAGASQILSAFIPADSLFSASSIPLINSLRKATVAVQPAGRYLRPSRFPFRCSLNSRPWRWWVSSAQVFLSLECIIFDVSVIFGMYYMFTIEAEFISLKKKKKPIFSHPTITRVRLCPSNFKTRYSWPSNYQNRLYLKEIGCFSLRGGEGELDTIKTLTYGSN